MSFSIILFSNLFSHFLEIFNNFSNLKILIFQMLKLNFFLNSRLLNFENSLILQIKKFRIFDFFRNYSIIAILEID